MNDKRLKIRSAKAAWSKSDDQLALIRLFNTVSPAIFSIGLINSRKVILSKFLIITIRFLYSKNL